MSATAPLTSRRVSPKSGDILPVWQGKRRWYLTSLVALGIAQAGLILGIGLLVARLFGQIGGQATIASAAVTEPLMIVMAAALLLGVSRWVERVLAESLGQDYVTQMRLKLFRHLLHTDQRSAQRFSHGVLLLRFVTDLNGMRRWVAFGLARLVVVISTVGVTLAALAYLQPALAQLLGGAILLSLSFCLLIGIKLPAPTRAVRKYRGRLAATMNDRVGTVSTVQAFAQERRELRRVRRQSQSLNESIIQRAHVIGSLQGALETCTILATAGLLVAGIYLVGEDRLTVSDIAAGMTLAGLLLSPLRDLGRIFDYWQQWSISREKIAGFLRLPKRARRPTAKAATVPAGPGHLRARRLSIPGLLKPSYFEIAPGQHVVLQGRNGAGKTSLLMTLAGILPLQKGRLYLDGHALTGKNAKLHRAQIGLVSHDIGLMRGSIGRNITYANPRASAEEIDQVLRQCNLRSLIEQLPRGLETPLSEGGRNLSVGERKRVMLARALLARPRVLLLDELDAHLDSQSLEIIEKTLRHFQGALIEVCHHRCLNLGKPTQHWQLQNARLFELTDDSMEDVC